MFLDILKTPRTPSRSSLSIVIRDFPSERTRASRPPPPPNRRRSPDTSLAIHRALHQLFPNISTFAPSSSASRIRKSEVNANISLRRARRTPQYYGKPTQNPTEP